MKDFFKNPKNAEKLFCLAAFLIPFLVYLRTLCPTVFTGDSGELIAASYTLGIPHPPGYPLYCLLGKLFTFFPFGNIAYRVNLLSAFFASLTVGFLYLVILRLGRRPFIAWASSLLFAFSRDFWSEATSAEVYTLNTFFFALLLYLLLLWEEKKDRKILLLSFFFFGLGLGNHHTLLVFGPVLLFLLFDEPPLLKDIRFLGKCAFFFALGLSVYFYLPLRAMAHPPVTWGVTPSLKSVLGHILRRRYDDIAHASYRLSLYRSQLLYFLSALGRQGLSLVWIFSLFGIARLFSKQPKLFWITGSLFLGTTLLLILVINFEPTHTNFYLMRPMFLPAWFFLSVFEGYGLSLCFEKKKQFFIAGLLLFLPFSFFVQNFRANDLSRHRGAEDFGRDLLKTVRPNGILFVSGDDPHFILAYLKHVLKLRPDVDVIALEGGVFQNVTRKNLFKFLLGNRSKTIYTNTKEFALPSGFVLKTDGLLYRVVRKKETISRTPFLAYRIKTFEKARENDLFEKFILLRYLWAKEDLLLEDGHPEEARKHFSILSDFAKGEPFLQIQLGKFCIQEKWMREGYHLFQEAYRLTPEDPEVWKGLGITLGQLGHYRESIAFLLRAAERHPRDPDITFNLGASFGNLRDFDKALFWWRKTLLLDPHRRDLSGYLEKAGELKRLNRT